MDVDLNLKSELFMKALFELIDTQPPNISHNFTWESLTLTEGYEKPPKEDLERRYQELIDGFPIQQLRETRNILLKETDWTDKYNIEEWVAYRQALRDLPENTEDPTNPVWPEQPQVKIVQEKNTWTELSNTKTDLSETETNLQTTQTELADAKTDLEEKTYQIISLEARLAALEQKFISN